MRFSQRIGKTSFRTVLQVDQMDKHLRTGLWNLIHDDYLHRLGFVHPNTLAEFNYMFWKDFLKEPIDEIPTYEDGRIDNDTMKKMVRNLTLSNEWHYVYDFIEFLSESTNQITSGFDEKCNTILKKEQSAFRILNKKIVQITTDEEINEIEEAINDTSQWKSVNTHMITALNFLADRENPNYRNSIKESISAVEALCVIITGDKKATLGKALGIIENKHSLHRALKDSFSALYGYTSDSSGIRHSLIENDATVDFEEAKFMLVSCSAFINFLKSKFTS
jgi:hypothetical protein